MDGYHRIAKAKLNKLPCYYVKFTDDNMPEPDKITTEVE